MGSLRMGLFRPAEVARLTPVFQAEQTSRMSDKPAIRPNGAVGEALKAVARDILAEALGSLDDLKEPAQARVGRAPGPERKFPFR